MSDASPWRLVLAQVRCSSDALALMGLFEYRDAELLANGAPITDVLECAPGEHGLAELLAEHLTALDGSPWPSTDFFPPSRGLDPTDDEIAAFRRKCELVGVRLHYGDARRR